MSSSKGQAAMSHGLLADVRSNQEHSAVERKKLQRVWRSHGWAASQRWGWTTAHVGHHIFQDSARHTAHTSGRDLFWELSKLQKATAIETAKRAPDGKTLPNISTQCFVLAFGYRLLWW